MATVNKIMKTFNVPNGSDVVCYEIVDDKGRKAIAKDWASNSTAAYDVGEYTMKDGVVYRFKVPHKANTAWNASEVDATNLGAELTSFHGDMKALDGKKANADSMFLYKSAFPGSVVEVEDAVAECVKQMQIEIAPVQDLHGYGKPWVGGAGKNLLPMTVAWIKAANTSGTWSGNAYTINGVTFTILTDNDGNVTGIKANGTASAGAMLVVGEILGSESKSYTYNGLTSQGSDTTFRLYWTLDGSTRGPTGVSGDTQTVTNITNVRVYVASGYTASNLMFYPMIRLSSETDATFAPYSNICPISGHTGCEIVRTGKNLYHGEKTKEKMINENGEIVDNSNTLITAYMRVKPNTTYTLSGTGLNASGVGVRVNYFDEYQNWKWRSDSSGINGITFTTDSDTAYVRFTYHKNAINEQLEKGSAATTYEPFGKVYSIQFPSPTPGTVYGGTLTLNQDGTGTLVVDRAITNFGEVNWQLDDNTPGRFIATISNMKPCPESVIVYAGTDVISSHYSYSALSKTNMPDGTIRYNAQNRSVLFAKNSAYSTAEAFKEAGSGVSLCYPLANAASYTISVDQVHLLLGYNTLYASTGSILSMLYPTSQVEAVANAKADSILEVSSTPAAVMSFSDGADGIPMGVEVAIEPVQDLHGYDKPWVGGAGKNLAPCTVDFIKASNSDSSSSWSGNICARGNVTYELKTDDANNVIGILANGSETSNKSLAIGSTSGTFVLPAGTYILNGCPESGSQTTYQITVTNSSYTLIARDTGNGASFTLESQTSIIVFCDIRSGYSATNVLFKPMIRLATESDATFAPYSNICPISGFDHAEVTRTGKNLFNGHRNDGYISDTGVEGTDNTNAHSDYIPVVVGKTYVYSWKTTSTSNVNRRIHGYDKNKNWVQMIEKNQTVTSGNKAFTIPAGVAFIRVQFLVENHADAETEVQIEEGSTVTSYEPYSGNTYSITFPTSAGTVYGGTLKVNKDGSGVLVVDRYYAAFDGTEDMSLASGGSSDPANSFIRITADKNGNRYPRVPNTSSVRDASISSVGKAGSILSSTTQFGFTIYYSSSNTYPFIQFRDPAIIKLTTSEEAKAYVKAMYDAGTPLDICYYLETPATYNIPAPIIKSILGLNNVWASTGNVNSAEWSADTKSYIDNLFSSITSAEGQTF